MSDHKETKRKIEVMQAAVDGRPIESRIREDDGDGPWPWRRVHEFCWDWDDFEYRVARSTAFVNIYPNGIATVYPTRREADLSASSNRIACVRFGYAEGQFDE